MLSEGGRRKEERGKEEGGREGGSRKGSTNWVVRQNGMMGVLREAGGKACNGPERGHLELCRRVRVDEHCRVRMCWWCY